MLLSNFYSRQPIRSVEKVVKYVDDTFIIWEMHLTTSYITLMDFTTELNSPWRLKDNKLAFLNVLLERKGTSLHTSVYRKPTHMNR